jgi:N-acylneuraminate cytidylyltransferase
MNCIGFIFARGGSKGVPRKNIKLLGGKPLVAYAIESALGSKFIDRVIISTDDLEIADVARQFGAEVPFMRPEELAADTAAEILSWRHAIEYCRQEKILDVDQDLFVSIPCTSPFRQSVDIDNCIEALGLGKADIAITITEARRHPSFNMVKKNAQGLYELAVPLNGPISRRQDAPVLFDITTVCYVAHPKYILNTESILKGRVAASIIPPERALDIDTELDFRFAEFLMGEG